VGGAAGEADARGDDQRSRPEDRPQASGLTGRGDHAVAPRLAREDGQVDRVPLDGDRHAQLAQEGRPVETREDGDRHDPGPIAPGRPGRFRRGPQHRCPARGVHGEEPDTEPCGRRDGARHRRRDVVVLEIEEHAAPAPPDHLHRRRSDGGEERAPNLEVRDDAGQTFHESLGCRQAGHVESDDQAVTGQPGSGPIPDPGHAFRLS